jgi:hypothetical protein
MTTRVRGQNFLVLAPTHKARHRGQHDWDASDSLYINRHSEYHCGFHIESPIGSLRGSSFRARPTHRQSLRLRCFLRFLSTEAPSLDRSYPASLVLRASPSPATARPTFREVPVDRRGDHRWASRVAATPHCLHAVATTPAGLMELVRSYCSINLGLPLLAVGRHLHCTFRGLLSVHSRYGLHARQVAYATLYTRGSDDFVSSIAALIATGWSEPAPGRDLHPLRTSAFHGAPQACAIA